MQSCTKVRGYGLRFKSPDNRSTPHGRATGSDSLGPRSASIAFYLLAVSLGTVSWVNIRQTDVLIVLLLLFRIRSAVSHALSLTISEKLYLLLLCIMAAWSLNPSGYEIREQLIASLYFIRGALVYLVLRTWITNYQDLCYFLRTCAKVAAVIVGFGILELVLKYTIGYSPRTFYGSASGTARFTGLAGNPNYFAHWLVILLGCTLMFPSMTCPDGGKRGHMMTVLFLLICGCVLTMSRGAWVASGVSYTAFLLKVLYSLVKTGRVHRSALTVLIFTTVGLLLSIVFITSDKYAMTRVNDALHGTGAHRYEAWELSLEAYSDFSPMCKIFGVGGQQHVYYVPFTYWPHNNYILWLMEYGVAGLIVFGLLLWIVVTARPRTSMGPPMLAFGLLGALTFAVSNDTLITTHFWVIVGLLLLESVIARAEPSPVPVALSSVTRSIPTSPAMLRPHLVCLFGRLRQSSRGPTIPVKPEDIGWL